MDTKAQEDFAKFKDTNKEYLELEALALAEIEQNEMELEKIIIDEIIKAGYTGKATEDDWVRLFEDTGGREIYGDHINRLSKELTGDIKQFIDMYKKQKSYARK